MNVPLARRNTFHHNGKLALGVLSIAASLAMILVLLGLRSGLYASITAYIDHLEADLVVAQSGVQGLFISSSSVPADIHPGLEGIAQSTEVGHILVASVIFTQGDAKIPILLFGYEPASNFGGPWKLGEGRYLQGDNEILLDSWLAERSGIKLGDSIELLGRQFRVVGLTRETASWMSPYVFISLEAAEEMLGVSGTVSYHMLRLATGAEKITVASAIEDEFTGVDVLLPSQIAEADQRVLATIMETPIKVLLFVAIFTGIAVMGLSSYTAVADRMREYGVLKAVGANSRRLAGLVVQETYYQAGMGLALGIALSYVAANGIMLRWPQFNILIEPANVLQVSLLALFMSLVSALLPVSRLARIDPVVAFKS
jgi:putative ABC transport system permease protein